MSYQEINHKTKDKPQGPPFLCSLPKPSSLFPEATSSPVPFFLLWSLLRPKNLFLSVSLPNLFHYTPDLLTNAILFKNHFLDLEIALEATSRSAGFPGLFLPCPFSPLDWVIFPTVVFTPHSKRISLQVSLVPFSFPKLSFTFPAVNHLQHHLALSTS